MLLDFIIPPNQNKQIFIMTNFDLNIQKLVFEKVILKRVLFSGDLLIIFEFFQKRIKVDKCGLML